MTTAAIAQFSTGGAPGPIIANALKEVTEKLGHVDANVVANASDNLQAHDRLDAPNVDTRNAMSGLKDMLDVLKTGFDSLHAQHDALRAQHDALQAPLQALQDFVGGVASSGEAAAITLASRVQQLESTAGSVVSDLGQRLKSAEISIAALLAQGGNAPGTGAQSAALTDQPGDSVSSHRLALPEQQVATMSGQLIQAAL